MPFDSRSFDAFFDSYYQRLCLFVYRIVGSDLMVDDIATDAFVVVWERRTTLPDVTAAQKLLYHVARNAAFNYVRTERSHEQKIAYEVAEGELGVGSNSSEGNPERDAEQSDVDSAVRAAIAELPPIRRQVYTLRWEQGWSTSEIAQALELSVKTVEMHVTLAHKTLRGALSDYRL